MAPLFDSKAVELLRKEGTVAAAEALIGKKYIMLYFSAHWCPPCRSFTPILKDFYARNKERSSFEIIFVSRDNTAEELRSYFDTAHGDWLALSYRDAQTVGEGWAKQYGIYAIPSLVVLENTEQHPIITSYGRDMVLRDPAALQFPWSNADAIMIAARRSFMWKTAAAGVDGLTVSLQQALRTKRYVILFLAGQWWAPCRGVAAQLCSFYSSLHDTFNFEVIFLSTDRSETTMLDFFHSSHGDWLCLNYNDARHLEAALAGDKELHPKQVPACLVFELEDGSSRADDTRNGQANGAAADTSTFSSSSSAHASTSPHSFARLITKHGREMLSRDKEGALFPWYDDGWDDAAAQQRSALLRKSSMEQTSTLASTRMPPPETPSAEPEGARCVEDSESKAAHNGLAPRTNPHPTLPHPSLPSTDAASAATPSTPLVTKHQPATVAQTEGHEVDAAATQDEDEEGEGAHEKDEKMREDVGPKHASDAVEGSAAAVEAGAAGNGTPEEEDAPSSTRHDETAPESRRQLTYSRSPDSRDEVKREPRLSRVIVMDRDFAASICTAQVEVETKNREAGEGDRDGDGEREAEEEAGVRPHEMLETHISTVTKVFSTNVSAATDEDKAEGAATAAIVFAAVVEAEAGADGEDDKTLEFSAIDKSVPVSGDASVE